MARFTSLPDLRFARFIVAVGLVSVSGAACGDDGETTTDTSSSASGSSSAGTGGGSATGATSGATTTAATTASASSTATGVVGGCLDDHAAGERFSLGDDCNFCDCNADGTTTCTTRTCPAGGGDCEYGGAMHAYGEHFPSTDACNECVCAASGLACTRRACTVVDEGAILVESLDTPCGSDPTFTAQAVLDGLPFDDFVAPFVYRVGGAYPETLPDTTVRVRVLYEDGFAVCRIPSPGQEAFDIEVVVEWITADGSFDEGFHTFLRKNASGFVLDWTIGVGAPANGLDGSYAPHCLDASGFAFAATFHEDQTVDGDVVKICETDISLQVGRFTHP